MAKGLSVRVLKYCDKKITANDEEATAGQAAHHGDSLPADAGQEGQGLGRPDNGGARDPDPRQLALGVAVHGHDPLVAKPTVPAGRTRVPAQGHSREESLAAGRRPDGALGLPTIRRIHSRA